MKTKMHNGHVVVNKPWGHYVDIHRSKEVVFKQIVVNSGEELSLQSHSLRDEFWFISSGVGVLTIGSQDYHVKSGDIYSIYKGVKHKIKNDGPKELVVFETQTGICDEEDIVRYDDKYGRTT